MRHIILALCLLATPALAQADYGGRIVDYYDRPSDPITGYCASACTLRLKFSRSRAGLGAWGWYSG